MKEEELIKKLEGVELPEIELQSHRRWLRMALLSAGYPKRQWGVTVCGSVKSKMKVGVDIITKGLASQQPVWKVAIISVCVLALVAVGSWMLLSREQAYAGALVKRAQMEIETLASALSMGKTLHIREQIYRRYGPAASRILEDSWALPESSYGDMWMRVDSDGNFYCFQSAVTDSGGNVWQESKTVDGEQVTRDVKSGEERWSPSRSYPVAQFLKSVASRPQRLLDKGWKFVGNGQWDGRETAVFEKHASFVNRGTDLEHGYVIPWVADLNAVETIFRFEIVINNPLFYSEETWVENTASERTLVEQHRRVIIEVLDEPPPLAQCPPSYVVRTFTLADADEVLDLASLLPTRFERVDAASEGLSREDLGLGPTWSEVYLYRSDETDELVYAYLTIMPEPADEQVITEVVKGLKAGDIRESLFGMDTTDMVENEVADILRNPQGSGYGGGYSGNGFESGSVRVDRVFVAIYRVSTYPDREPLSRLAERIWSRIGKFDQ